MPHLIKVVPRSRFVLEDKRLFYCPEFILRTCSPVRTQSIVSFLPHERGITENTMDGAPTAGTSIVDRISQNAVIRYI
jgi:hypothetical protein